jgi:hypothetical protein
MVTRTAVEWRPMEIEIFRAVNSGHGITAENVVGKLPDFCLLRRREDTLTNQGWGTGREE